MIEMTEPLTCSQSWWSGHWQPEIVLADHWDNTDGESLLSSLKLTLLACSHERDPHQVVQSPPSGTNKLVRNVKQI